MLEQEHGANIYKGGAEFLNVIGMSQKWPFSRNGVGPGLPIIPLFFIFGRRVAK